MSEQLEKMLLLVFEKAGVLLSVIALTLVVRLILFWLVKKLVLRVRYWPKNFNVSKHFIPTVSVILFLVIFRLVLPAFEFGSEWLPYVKKAFQLSSIVVITWFLIRLTAIFRLILFERFDISKEDNLENRKMQTQIYFIEKIVVLALAILCFCLVLMSFKEVRQLGMGLLTSASIVGIIVGFAAQKTLGNLIAGFQIAFTQPIRIDDVVIVENEWGRIEEITLTYVVVRIWDLRRLVLPITYFTEKPFQNWTRQQADIFGTVYLNTDYTLPIELLREAFQNILKESPLWDEKVAVLQVTDSTEKTMQIRLLMSARNSSEAWDLRCFVREKVIGFIQEKYPQCLPKTRFEGEGFLPEVGAKDLSPSQKAPL